MSLLDLPNEIILHILKQLHATPNGILSVRQTCKSLASITRDHALWAEIIYEQRQLLPLGPSLRVGTLDQLSSSELEIEAIHAYMVDKQWLQPRDILELSIPVSVLRIFHLMEVIAERWLICLCGHRKLCVLLWDMLDTPPSLKLQRWLNDYVEIVDCHSAAASIDAQATGIKFALGSLVPRQVVVWNIDMNSMSLELVRRIPTAKYTFVRAVHPSLPLVIASQVASVKVIRWGEDETALAETQTMPAVESDVWEEHVLNGIIAISLLGVDYALCVQRHTIAVVPLDGIRRPVHQEISERGFRLVSLTRPVHSVASQTYTAQLLEYTEYQGLSRHIINYNVSAHSLDVTTCEEVISDISLGSSTSPGFVAACIMGPQGRRGLWVERAKRSVERSVVAFRIDGPDSVGNRDVITRGVVCSTKSYDLQDDIIDVAFSESGGDIVLATRSGKLLVTSA